MIYCQYPGYINVLGGFFLSVTNKMLFHIIEKVHILIYLKQSLKQ